MSELKSAEERVAVTYDDLNGRTWRYTFCPKHRPRVSADENMLNVRTERTDEPCSLGCSPCLNWRVDCDEYGQEWARWGWPG